jgi:hypothetical protein
VKMIIPCSLLSLAAIACSPPPQAPAPSLPYRVTFQEEELAAFKLRLMTSTQHRGSYRATLQNNDAAYTVHAVSVRIKAGRDVRICNVTVEVKPRSTATFYLTNGEFSVPDEYQLLSVEASRS